MFKSILSFIIVLLLEEKSFWENNLRREVVFVWVLRGDRLQSEKLWLDRTIIRIL